MHYVIMKKQIGKVTLWVLYNECGIVKACRTRREALETYWSI